MSRRASSIRIAAWLISGLAVVVCPACGTTSRPDPERYLTDPAAARRAVEESLETWRKSPDLERTTQTIQPVMFVDQSRKPGQRLREFTVLGEAAGADGCRRFQVKLALEQPDESILVAYYVFGQGPIWVYRAEEFEMIMRHGFHDRGRRPSRAQGRVESAIRTSQTRTADGRNGSENWFETVPMTEHHQSRPPARRQGWPRLRRALKLVQVRLRLPIVLVTSRRWSSGSGT